MRKEERVRHHRRRRRVVVAFLVLAVVAAGGLTIARSSLFALNGIEVRGAGILTRAEILQASGVKTGQSMMSIHTDQIEARLTSMAFVASAKVARIYPSRLRISIVERQPAFVLETTEERRLIDASGMVLADVQTSGVWDTLPDLPTLRVEGEIAADPGDLARVPAVTDALRLWALLPADMRAGTPVLDATQSTALTLVRPEIEVRFGSLDRIAEKIAALREVLDRARQSRDRLTMVDVRAPSRPAATIGR